MKIITARPGQSFEATAQVFDQDNNPLPSEVAWKSSNPDVASPEKETANKPVAKVWCKNPGTATLIATSGSAFQTLTVLVEALRPTKVAIQTTDPQ